jgi:hypothetical protein
LLTTVFQVFLISNYKIEAWVELFPDTDMGNAAVDRLTNQAHYILLEGDSYRCNMRPTLPGTKQHEKDAHKPKEQGPII